MQTVVPIRSKRLRRMVKMQAVQHIAPSFLLFSGGLESLHEVPLLGVFEIAAGGLMLIVALWELKAKHHEEGAAVRWADLFAAAMLLGEGLHRAHAGGHYLPYLYVLLSVLMVVRAYAWKTLSDRRRLVIDNDGFSFRRRFKSVELPWTAVRSMDVKDTRIEIASAQGPVIIDLTDVENRMEITDAFRDRSRETTPPRSSS